ncbi:putative phospholipase B-like 2 [Leptotrombidium deliense]|uniref:Phospholipase B-like n=1 Tax=Leptotrombidium deliense TaxID=299467 RepID=A0A443SB61_9ACAR|nr:putative phospholipase B-like 2 [Leptotrombidium deliense]
MRLLFVALFSFTFTSNFVFGFRKIAVKLNPITNDLTVIENYKNNGFDVDTIAWGYLDNFINKTGWAILEVNTSPNVSDSMQAYVAGFIEGALTKHLIDMHWTNVIGDYCHGQEDYCKKLDVFLKKNLDFIKSNIEKFRHKNPYWHHVALVLEQLAGLDDGYRNKTSFGPHMNIDLFGLNLINIMGDAEDLSSIINAPTKFKKVHGSGSCSALIKVLPKNADLYVSQDTWNDYNSMLRIIKQHNFNFRSLPNSNAAPIAGNSASFSSYPGALQSGDDFYVLSSGLVTLETTIGNGNMSLYKYIKPDAIVLEWIRSIVANRIANSGQEWVDVFVKYNSGTYNNQWMIVDYKMFEPLRPLKKGLLTVVEQIPTLVAYDDTTYVLRKQQYWPSYNTPFFENIFNISGGPAEVAKYGDWFTYEKTPRALIFKRDQKKVKDLKSMIKLMRYNNYKHDNLSRCHCNPPYSAENAIAARSDLNPKSGTYPFGALGHRNHGATDMKLTNNKLRKTLNFIAIAGPPHDDVPAFQWSTSDFANSSHVGHPDKWVFNEIVTPF